MQNFTGATAISSNAYHGRPEEDEEDTLADEGGLLGELGQNETVAQLERGIRDMAGRLMANPDVQNLGESLRTGALRVSLVYFGFAGVARRLTQCLVHPDGTVRRLPPTNVGTALIWYRMSKLYLPNVKPGLFFHVNGRSLFLLFLLVYLSIAREIL